MWTDKKRKLFSEVNDEGHLVVGEVVVDDYACSIIQYNTPLGKKIKEERPIYREILRQKVLTKEEEKLFDIMVKDDTYHSQSNAILYFLEPQPEQAETLEEIRLKPQSSFWRDLCRLLAMREGEK